MKKRIRGIILSAILAFSIIPAIPEAHAADNSGTTASKSYSVALTSPTSMRTIQYYLYEAENSDVASVLASENNERTHEIFYDSSLQEAAVTRAKEIAVFFSNTRPNGEGGFASIEKIAHGDKASVVSDLTVPDDAEYYTAIGHVIYNGVDYWAQLYNTTGTRTGFSADNASQLKKASISLMGSYMLGGYTVTQTPGDFSLISGEEGALPEYTIAIKVNDSVHNTDDNACVLAPASTNNPTWNSGITAVARISPDGTKVVGENVGKSELSATLSLSSLDSVVLKSLVTVTQADMQGANMELAPSYPLNGGKCEPKPTVKLANGTTLVENKDYVLEYKSNTAVGTGSVTAKGIGNYSGSVTGNFLITADPGGSISTSTLALAKTDPIVYDGTEKKPEVTLTRNGAVLDASNYDLTYTENIKAGTATVTAAGKGIYSGTKSLTFKIEPASLKDATITFGSTKYTFTGNEIKPAITVKAGNVDVAATDYTVSYKNNIQVSSTTAKASVTITGKNNFKDSKSADFTIDKGTLEGGRLEFWNSTTGNFETTYSMEYDGSTKTPMYTRVTLNDGKDVIKESYYDIAYNPVSPVDAGEVKVTVTGKGDFAGSTVTGSYTITPKDGKNLTVSKVAAKSFTGKEQTPAVTVKDGSKLLKVDTDYTLTYENNQYPGTATVTVTYIGNYTGSYSQEFKISMKKPTMGSVSGGKKRFTASWSKPSGTFKKYQLQYATSSSMSGSTKVAVAKSKSSLTVKKLKKGTYYVRIRTYYKDSTGTYYSSWSAKKKVSVS